MAKTGFAGAKDRLRAIVHTRPVTDALRRLARRAPDVAERATSEAVTEWHREAVVHMPVRAKGSRRGQTRKRTQPFVRRTSDVIEGGIRVMVAWAIWLVAGTRHIAGGAVMAWKPGDPLITDWPAKRAGGGPRGALPIVIPWLAEARDRMVERLRRGL